jgi:holo-[acyl-carrier protein] synthase
MYIYTSIGCDIVKISRIKKILNEKTIYEKIFHKSELEYFESRHLAGIFAGKEATFKALGLKHDQWLDIEIKSDISGKPKIKLSSKLRSRKIISIDLSISHEDEYAIAIVSVLKKKQ